MQPQNPFKYGMVVTGKDFVNRKEEIDTLTKNLTAGQHIILYSKRRLGKTSLMRQTMTLLPKQVIPVYIDLFGITSKKILLKKMMNELLTVTYPKFTMLKNELQKLLKKITVKIVLVKDTVELELQTGETVTDEEFEEICNLPEKIAQRKGKQLIVMFDEFQDITEISSEHLEKTMRSTFQHHKHVSYLFAGSKTTLMHELFNDPKQAFYRFGKEMRLGMIPKKDFESFIQRKFKQTGKYIAPSVIDMILNFTDGHPYFTQKICQQIWYDSSTTVDAHAVPLAIQKITQTETDFYEQIWNSLTPFQKRLLVGLVTKPEMNIYSQDFIHTFALASSAHVKRAYESLEKKRIIEDKKISDIFFSEWIKRIIT